MEALNDSLGSTGDIFYRVPTLDSCCRRIFDQRDYERGRHTPMAGEGLQHDESTSILEGTRVPVYRFC